MVKRKLTPWFYALFALAFTVLLCAAAYLLGGSEFDLRHGNTSPVSAPSGKGINTVVLDAGHGGEDGGASSAQGLLEKDVNLAVALYLRDYLEAAGIPVVMTRTEDKLLYDRNVDFDGRKKVLDLNARLHTAQAVPESLFVSIHMNSFPQKKYSGTQVWYSVKDPRSMEAASAVQSRSILLDPFNHRRIKPAGSNIFLLDRLETPGILIEGGFMSNTHEAELLGTEEYQKKLAFILFTGIVNAMA
ncbi:MAG: N-acetylmuramoyl-L-alanine amidase [Clostridia bacterium]|nr:N-acetylmuramoyl-L-alanine amidase [Clostridia bacterium]